MRSGGSLPRSTFDLLAVGAIVVGGVLGLVFIALA
ncbi:MAG: hypothetical protein QOI25_3778 [Mycobacterium sp.]|nr:hypothetical protein [Mycobacterium sp.]